MIRLSTSDKSEPVKDCVILVSIHFDKLSVT